MANLDKRTIYFKLIGKQTYYFRVDNYLIEGAENENCLTYLWCYNAKTGFPWTRDLLDEKINSYIKDYRLEYKLLTKEEIESLKLLYEL